MKVINEIIDIFNKDFKEKVETLKNENFMSLFDVSQEFKTNKKDQMSIIAKIRS